MKSENGDWKKMTLEEKKALYRFSFCQTIAEYSAENAATLLFLSGKPRQVLLNTLSSHIPPPLPDADEPKRKILLVHAHPVADSFSAAIADAVEAGAK